MMEPDLHDLDPDDVRAEYDRRGLDRLSDARLIDAAAALIGRPKRDEAQSFVLHAPLELLARAALLQHVSDGVRHDARVRIVWLAATYSATGPDARVPSTDSFDDAAGALDALRSSVRAGDLERAWAAGGWLGRSLDAAPLIHLVADDVLPSLAAAAHGPIFLHHLGRAAARSPLAGALFGNLARELARHPTWTLTWMDRVSRRSGDLRGALATAPVLGVPGSSFIRPLMDQAESSGLAAEVVGASIGRDTDLHAATRILLRIATASMLLDDVDHAAYGWSHCLTIPQAVASVAVHVPEPDRALAVAATHVLGFRAAIGSAPLEEVAAGTLGTDARLPTQRPRDPEIQAVVDHAAVHPDAHLAKYTVACLDAARTDPDGAAQHLAAAVHLDRWWREQPAGPDPLLGTVEAPMRPAS